MICTIKLLYFDSKIKELMQIKNKGLIITFLVLVYGLVTPVAGAAFDPSGVEEKFVICHKQKPAGTLSTKIEVRTINDKKFTYVKTETVSTTNRWFPGKKVTTVDEEYLDENYQIVWFKSKVIYKDKEIFLFGRRKANNLYLTRYTHNARHAMHKVKSKLLSVGNNHYTSGALRFVYKTQGLVPGRSYSIYVLDKKHFKWRKINIKVDSLQTIDFNHKLTEVYPIKANYYFLLSSVSYVDKDGNPFYSNGRKIEIRRIE